MDVRKSQVAALIAVGAAQSVALAQYAPVRNVGALEDLSPGVPTPPTSTGVGINNNGDSVGASLVSGGSTPQHGTEPVIPHAYVSQPGVGIVDLGIIEAGVDFVQVWSIAHDINDAGLIVGDQNQLRAFAWSMGSSGEPEFVTLPMPGNRARAYGVNNRSTIVGFAQTLGSVVGTPASWRFDDKENAWVSQIFDLFPGALQNGEARDINELDQTVGWVFRESGFGIEETSWINLPEPAFGLPAGTHDMTPGLAHDRIVAINDRGIAVGGTRFVTPSPMIWDPHVSEGEQPRIYTVWPTEITTANVLDYIEADRLLGATFNDINNNDIIVGTAEYEFIEDGRSGIKPKAIVYLNDRYQLLDLLAADSGWQSFVTAEGINDNNEIVGTGIDEYGNQAGYVLPLNGLCVADMQEPHGSVDYFDISEFLNRFVNQDPRADLAHPYGIFNIHDVSDFISAYLFECGSEP